MHIRSTLGWRRFGLFFLLVLSSVALAQSGGVRVRRVALLGSEAGLQLKVSADAPVATESQVLSGPDRIVIDFLGAVPGEELRGFAVKQAGIRAVRVGLFAANPPRTRVVIDLDRPISYQLLPSGAAVLINLGSGPKNDQPALLPVNTSGKLRFGGATVTPPAPAPPVPPLQVTYNSGQLFVSARNATLADVLYQVHLRTGAEIAIPSGAEQERVVMTVGPGPAKEVMANLLNGSRFNFVLVGSAQDQNILRNVILSPKMDGGFQQVITGAQPAAAPPPPADQPVESALPEPPEAQPDPGTQPQPGQQPGVQQSADPQAVPEAPIPEAQVPQGVPNQGQGQTIPAPKTPPPPPTEEPNRPWTEPPPSQPQPDF